MESQLPFPSSYDLLKLKSIYFCSKQIWHVVFFEFILIFFLEAHLVFADEHQAPTIVKNVVYCMDQHHKGSIQIKSEWLLDWGYVFVSNPQYNLAVLLLQVNNALKWLTEEGELIILGFVSCCSHRIVL